MTISPGAPRNNERSRRAIGAGDGDAPYRSPRHKRWSRRGDPECPEKRSFMRSWVTSRSIVSDGTSRGGARPRWDQPSIPTPARTPPREVSRPLAYGSSTALSPLSAAAIPYSWDRRRCRRRRGRAPHTGRGRTASGSLGSDRSRFETPRGAYGFARRARPSGSSPGAATRRRPELVERHLLSMDLDLCHRAERPVRERHLARRRHRPRGAGRRKQAGISPS
jgi:hypothetical protein